MNSRELDTVRITPGETLVVIPRRELSSYQITRLNEVATAVGVKLLILPAGASVLIQRADQ